MPCFKPGPHCVLSGGPGASSSASHVHSGDDNCDENNNEQLSPRTI